ncbi:MAG TPA: ester cyclase [Kineosporiaceae bacterium]|jgi:ketosteroid isomerase-like protein|nr:ester cyclase [Kineosporiaceae bacterium]
MLDQRAAEQLLAAMFAVVAEGDPELAVRCIHPDFVNEESANEPPACSTPGPPGVAATGAWLRSAYSDLRYEVREVLLDGDRAMAQAVMSGRQTGPFVVFPHGGRPVAFPPTGRTFAVKHAHLVHFRDGLIVRHSAVRDDLGMMNQLGHLPPGPGMLARMARWNLSGGARRAVPAAVAHAANGAEGVATLTQ